MGEREMFLVLGAMFFSLMTNFSMNRFFVNYNEAVMNREYEYYAVSLAQGFIEEAKTKAFDEAVVNGQISNLPENFTNFYSLGPAWQESYPNFNDIDDYNFLLRIVNTPKADYMIFIFVDYITEGNLMHYTFSQTYYKSMTVIVYSQFMPDLIILNHVFSYYEF